VLPPQPECANEVTGDIFECERKLQDWACLIAHKYDIYMSRASNDEDSVEIPEVCLTKEKAE